MTPALPPLLWHDWHPQVGPLLDATAAATLYLLAARRAPGWPVWRSGIFLAGVAVVVVALCSGLDAWDDRLLSAHMIQHMLLLEVGPLLLLLGAPDALALRALPAPQGRAVLRAGDRLGVLTHPLVALAILWLVVLGLHWRPVFVATLHDATLHDLAHLSFLIAGLACFRPLHGGDPRPSRRLGAIGRLAYVMAAMVPMGIVGSYLSRGTTVIYPPYAAWPHALADQARAGAIMWVGSSLLMTAVALGSAAAALREAERRQLARDRYAMAP